MPNYSCASPKGPSQNNICTLLQAPRAASRSPGGRSPKGRGGEGPSALLALPDDEQRHRLRPAAWHPAPRRSRQVSMLSCDAP